MSITETLRLLPYRLAPAGGGASGRRLAGEVGSRVELLYRLALRYTGDESSAERAVVRTVERAMNGASRVRTEPDAAVWLAWLLREVCLTEHAGAVSAVRTVPLSRPRDVGYAARLPELAEELYAGLDGGELLALIDALPFDLREVLVLRDLEGFDDDDAGRITGLEPATVRVRLRAARLALERRVVRYLGEAAA